MKEREREGLRPKQRKIEAACGELGKGEGRGQKKRRSDREEEKN